MRVEKANILRNAGDIRRAVLSMQENELTAEQSAELVVIDDLAAEIKAKTEEFKTDG